MIEIYFIRILHFIIALYIIFGQFLLPSLNKYYIYIIPLLLYHWKTNNNNCFLSQLENYFIKNDNIKKNQKNIGYFNYNYINKKLNRFFKINISNIYLDNISIFILLSLWIWSLIKNKKSKL